MSNLRFIPVQIGNEKDKANPQLSGDMDIDSLPILHSPSIQPSQKNTEQNPFKDILLKAIQIAGI